MIAKAAGVRLRKREIPRQREPKAAQLRYQKLLTSIRKTLEKLLHEELIPALPALVAQGNLDRGGVRQDSAIEDIARVFSRMELIFGTYHPEEATKAEITQVAADIDTKQAQEHQRQMKAVWGVEVIVPEPFRQAAIEGFIADNQDLVKTLHDQQLETFKQITSKGIRSGLRVEDIRDELILRLGIVRSRAALLARDQTLKLFGELAEQRQRNVGITQYTWSASGDQRVRPRHAELHDTVQNWNEPPIVDYRTGRRAHPGGDYQCRCQAIPIIPEALGGPSQVETPEAKAPLIPKSKKLSPVQAEYLEILTGLRKYPERKPSVRTIPILMERGYLSEHINEKGVPVRRVTEEGKEVLRAYRNKRTKR